MSEPLSSHEIEDVLSSIRRLVSEDLRPAMRQTGHGTGPAVEAGADARPAPTAASAGRLVLTAALRVVNADEASVQAAPGAGAKGASPQAPQAAPAVPADDSAPLVPPVADDQAEPAEALFGGSDEDDVWAAPGTATDDDLDEDPELEPSTLTAAFRRGHWTAETVPQVAWVEDEEDWPDTAPLKFAAHRRFGAVEQPQPESAGQQTAGAAAEPPQAAVDASATAAPDPAGFSAARPAAPEQGLFDGDAPGIDEEMLRDIVREIIREELAGTLGERITRNVRKLVRVEINRALTAREFE